MNSALDVVRNDIHLVGRLFDAGQFGDARVRYEAIAEWLSGRSDDESVVLRACAIRAAASCLFNQGQMEESGDRYKEARQLSARVDDQSGLAKSEDRLAAVALRLERYDEAHVYAGVARARFAELGDYGNALCCSGHMGEALLGLRQSREAREVLSVALSGYEEAMPADVANRIARVAWILGGEYARLYDDERAIAAFRRGAEIADQIGDVDGRYFNWGELGRCLERATRLKEARDSFERSLSAALEAGAAERVSAAHERLRGVLKRLGQPEALLLALRAARDGLTVGVPEKEA